MYFEACDLLHGELEERFQDKHIPSVIAMEKTLLCAANGLEFEDTMETLRTSCYKNDIDMPSLTGHLQLLQAVIKQSSPEVKKVTSIQTICDAMNKESIFKEMLPTVHQLLRLYLSIPVTSATSERAFSALKRVLTYVHSTMTEVRFNNCLLHIHKDLTDTLEIDAVAKEFVNNDERTKYFGHFK